MRIVYAFLNGYFSARESLDAFEYFVADSDLSVHRPRKGEMRNIRFPERSESTTGMAFKTDLMMQPIVQRC
jgi:hypothetical protein